MKQEIPWQRFAVEAVVIVGSILLAFAIDAWWSGRQDRKSEVLSVELLIRDVNRTVTEASEFEENVSVKLASAAAASAALASPLNEIDRANTSENLSQLGSRTTVDFSSAAFIDLVNTGNLRVIRDPLLRDQIVAFFEGAAQVQTVIEKNSTLFQDELITQQLRGAGLIYSTGSTIREDPIWEFPPDSREWQRVRSVLYVYQVGMRASQRNAVILGSQAEELLTLLKDYLDVI